MCFQILCWNAAVVLICFWTDDESSTGTVDSSARSVEDYSSIKVLGAEDTSDEEQQKEESEPDYPQDSPGLSNRTTQFQEFKNDETNQRMEENTEGKALDQSKRAPQQVSEKKENAKEKVYDSRAEVEENTRQQSLAPVVNSSKCCKKCTVM